MNRLRGRVRLTARDLPTVSVLVPAHNYERFVGEALQSALKQEYPAELLEIVVVDDGSTDGTAAVVEAVAEANPGRIKFIRQQNQGQIATIARAREEASGELLAFLDADDVWLPAKTRKQVDAYLSAPNVGLIFCDMATIDTDGQLLNGTVYKPGEFEMDPVRLYARVLRSNVIYGGSSMYRADVFGDPPAAIEAWDWWLASSVTQQQAAGGLEVRFVPEALALYRQHGENMLLGAAGSKLIGMRRRQLGFQLWAIRTLDLTSLGPRELLDIWAGPEWFVQTAMQSVGSYFVDLIAVSDDHRAQARELRAQAQTARTNGDLIAEARLGLQALAWDPQAPDGAELLRDATARALAAEREDPLAGARGFTVLVDALELLAGDEMLLSYASTMAGNGSTTLAVDASQLPPDEAVANLRALLARCGLTERGDIDVVVVVDRLDAAQRQRMHQAVSAVYRRSPPTAEDPAPMPTFTIDDLAGLRLLADSPGQWKGSPRWPIGFWPSMDPHQRP